MGDPSAKSFFLSSGKLFYRLGVLTHFFIGFGGMPGIDVLSIAIPRDAIKSRLQSAPAGNHNGIVDCLQKGIMANGTRALFKDFGSDGSPCANTASFVGVEYSLKTIQYKCSLVMIGFLWFLWFYFCRCLE